MMMLLPQGEQVGDIVLHQPHSGRHFLAENPCSSELYELPAWIQVAQHPPTVWPHCDLCAACLRDRIT
eukprot:12889956-Prorocentrum_lima.AAC.1